MLTDRQKYMKKYNQLPKAKEKKREYKKKHYDEIKIYKKRYYERLRLECLSVYSNYEMKCKKCGYDDINALCIDHIDNNGSEQRKYISSGYNVAGPNFYRWIINNNFPNGFQILCRNCNWIKKLNHDYDGWGW